MKSKSLSKNSKLFKLMKEHLENECFYIGCSLADIIEDDSDHNYEVLRAIYNRELTIDGPAFKDLLNSLGSSILTSFHSRVNILHDRFVEDDKAELKLQQRKELVKNLKLSKEQLQILGVNTSLLDDA